MFNTSTACKCPLSAVSLILSYRLGKKTDVEKCAYKSLSPLRTCCSQPILDTLPWHTVSIFALLDQVRHFKELPIDEPMLNRNLKPRPRSMDIVNAAGNTMCYKQ
jgi:hypothetical protein